MKKVNLFNVVVAFSMWNSYGSTYASRYVAFHGRYIGSRGDRDIYVLMENRFRSSTCGRNDYLLGVNDLDIRKYGKKTYVFLPAEGGKDVYWFGSHSEDRSGMDIRYQKFPFGKLYKP